MAEAGIEAGRACAHVRSVQPAAFEPVQEWITQSEDLWRRQLLAFKNYAESVHRKGQSQIMTGDRARISVAVEVPPGGTLLRFSLRTSTAGGGARASSTVIQHPAADSSGSEAQLHGRLFESFDADGNTPQVIEVGRIRLWEPPHRLAFSWRNSNFAAGENTDVEISFEPNSSGTLVTVVHSGLASLRADHPARHGNRGAAFSRMMGLWWGEQMSALRQFCRELL